MCLETGEKKLEVGAIVSGKVTGIAKFGAFVEIAPKKTGLVHISEISNNFVRNVSDYFKEGQIVKVKILSISPGGKTELSIKQAEDKNSVSEKSYQFGKSFGEKQAFQKSASASHKANSFEDMMAKFKKMSEDKLSDIAAPTESRRRRNFYNNNS